VIGKTLMRGLVIAFGFVLGAFSALLALFALGTYWAGDAIRQSAPGDPVIDLLAEPFAAVLFIGAVTPALTALPALVAAIAGEVLQIRSFTYYVVMGGLALAAIPLLVTGQSGEFVAPSADYMTIFASAGFAGGFVYWLIAGRGA
jgi:hypothetical protein